MNLSVFNPQPDSTPTVGCIAAVRLSCPACGSRMPTFEIGRSLSLECRGCGFLIYEETGIVRTLTQESKKRFERFVREYEIVREKEGWGSQAPEYYFALPFRDLTNRHNWIWRIRSRTLHHMERYILPKVSGSQCNGCRILDLGAGNGWLSYRLSKSGYFPIAVDLLVGDIDGLGAARHYLAELAQAFPRFQADMDHLPFDSEQFDVAIFNASFHYSANYEKTLREVLRCLRRPATVIIADTPFYSHDEAVKRCWKNERQCSKSSTGCRQEVINLKDI